jgi:hypothetical protein
MDAGPSGVPNGISSRVQQSANTLNNAIGMAQNLAIRDPNFHQSRQNIINTVNQVWSEVGQYRPWILVSSADYLRELSERSAAALNNMSTITEAAKKARDEAITAAKAAKEAAALTAVSNLAGAYQEEAALFDRRARFWGRITFGIGCGAALLMGVYVHESLASSSFNVSQAIIRAVVVAAIFGVFTLCLRVYDGYRHLEVVNRHRVNIGRTFEAFKAAQPSDKAKEIVAALTAEHMLSFGKSGMLPKDASVQSPLSGFSDLLKAVLEGKN